MKLGLFRVAAALSLLLSVTSGTLMAQSWQPTGQFPGYVSLVKFVNPNVGFVGLGVGPGGPIQGVVGIYKTTDAGATWQKSAIPPNYAGEITDIEMTNALNGWAAVIPYRSQGNRGLWRTTDGGQSWTETSLVGACTGVRITSQTLVATDIFGSMHLSTDNGQSFQALPFSSTNGIDFVDDLHGAVVDFRGNQWLHSSDGGKSWLPSMQNTESWSVYGVKETPVFYAAPEGPTNGAPYKTQILRSTDYGATWNVQTTMPFVTTGHIVGVGEDDLFIQVSANSGNNPANNRANIYTSNDHGRRWSNLGGPGALVDTRFDVVSGPCGQITIYAFDDQEKGQLYRLQYRPSSAGVFAVSSSPVRVTSSLCTSADFAITVSGDACRSYRLDSVVVTSDSLASTGAVIRLSSPSLPDTLSGATQTLSFRWTPVQIVKTDTSLVGHIHLYYYDNLLGRIRDTSITIELVAKGRSDALSFSTLDLHLPPVSTCASLDTAITVFNTDCLSARIDSIYVGDTSSFTLRVDRSSLEAGDSMTIHIHYRPEKRGAYIDSETIVFESEGHRVLRTVRIDGSAIAGEASLSTALKSPYTFDPRTTCDAPDSVIFTITNPDCDTLRILNVSLDTTAQLAGIAHITIPCILTSSDSVNIGWRLDPSIVGSSASSIRITYVLPDGSEHDTIFSAFAEVRAAKKTLVQNLDDIDFGLTDICADRDSDVEIYNPSCDTVYVTDATIGKNFFLELPDTLPIPIPPGRSISVRVHSVVDTTGEPSDFTSTLQFSTDADSTLNPVRLHRAVYYPLRLRLELLDDDSASAGGFAKFRILLEGDPNTKIKQLSFDIAHDDDLLGFVELSSPVLQLISTTGVGSSVIQTFALTDGLARGEIGQLTFKTFLARDIQTRLQISNLQSHAYGESDVRCDPVITDSTSEFTYIYACGDKPIQDFLLQHLSISVGELSSSSADAGNRYTVSVPIKSAETLQITQSVVDETGREVRHSGSELRANSAQVLQYDLTGLPAGIYYLRVLSRTQQIAVRTVLVR